MTTDILKDPHGRPVQEISSTSVKSGVTTLLETVTRHGMVALTKNRKTKAVVLSVEEYQALLHRKPNLLDALDAHFDRLFDAMQGPIADAAFERVMNATPNELGKAAVEAASKSG